jgi:hypothetical protein
MSDGHTDGVEPRLSRLTLLPDHRIGSAAPILNYANRRKPDPVRNS